MKETITIGMAEDHGMLRQGLISLLKPYRHIQVLFDVNNGRELMERLKTERPQILLLDIEMPVMKGQEVMQKINLKYPRIKVIVVSAYFERDYILEFFKLGVKAFLSKVYTVEKIVEVIEAVQKHGIYTDPEVAKILAEELHSHGKQKNPGKPVFSESELDVLRLISKGMSRKKAAESLGVKAETVNFHMSNMLRKSACENTAALLRFAFKSKVIS